jgi:hypothetical protein
VSRKGEEKDIIRCKKEKRCRKEKMRGWRVEVMQRKT